MITTLAAAVTLATGSCPANLASSLAPTAASTQLVTVVAARRRTTYASLALWRKTGGCWQAVAGPWIARVGRNGLSSNHREGDGTTPTGTYGFGSVMYGLAPDPGVRYRYHRLVCGDWWDEDPASATYNTFRHLSCGARPPFEAESEGLWKQTEAHRHFAVIRYNVDPIVAGRGSAIFLHATTGRPTSGCVSLPPARLVTVIRWLRPARTPLIVIATRR